MACLTAILLTATAPAIGLTWDEPVYIAASESYMGLFGQLVTNPHQAMSPASIEYFWTVNYEHPALDKIWSGAVWTLARHLVDYLTAHRLGNILLVAVMFVRRLYSSIAFSSPSKPFPA